MLDGPYLKAAEEAGEADSATELGGGLRVLESIPRALHTEEERDSAEWAREGHVFLRPSRDSWAPQELAGTHLEAGIP